MRLLVYSTVRSLMHFLTRFPIRSLGMPLRFFCVQILAVGWVLIGSWWVPPAPAFVRLLHRASPRALPHAFPLCVTTCVLMYPSPFKLELNGKREKWALYWVGMHDKIIVRCCLWHSIKLNWKQSKESLLCRCVARQIWLPRQQSFDVLYLLHSKFRFLRSV